MQWDKVKTILIIFFLAVNIFLAGFLMISVRDSDYLNPEIIMSTISTLEQNNISADVSLIKQAPKNILVTELENCIKSNNEFARLLLGNDAQQLSDAYYVYGTKSLTIVADTFVYTDTAPTDSIHLTNQNIKARTVNELKKLGIIAQKSNVTEVINAGGLYKLKLINSIKDYPIYSSVIDVHISNAGIHYVSGCWFNYNSTLNDSKIKTKNITGILIDFISHEQRNKEQPSVIKDLSIGYHIEGTNEIFHRSATSVPVWRITCEDAVYYMDARSY